MQTLLHTYIYMLTIFTYASKRPVCGLICLFCLIMNYEFNLMNVITKDGNSFLHTEAFHFY